MSEFGFPVMGLSETPAMPISIYPVSNGWMVVLPPAHSAAKKMQKFYSTIIKEVKNDGNIPGPKEEENDELPDESVRLIRNVHAHIFPTFDKVLAFLKYKIVDEQPEQP